MPRKKITDGLRQRANGSWEISRNINGKRRWFTDKDPSVVWEKYNNALKQAELDDSPNNPGPLFEEVADVYYERVMNMKNGTQKSYKPAIKRAKDWFAGKHMEEIEPYMVSQFLKSLSGMARTTVSNQKTVLNSIFQIWIDSPEWKGDRNPSELTKLPRGLKRGKRLPPTVLQIQIVKDNYLDPDALIAVLCLCTGQRKGEACGIQVKDIDFEQGYIHVCKSVEHIGNKPHITTTKTESGLRYVPLLDILKQALWRFKDEDPDVFILSGTKTPLTESQYRKKWVSFWRKHGMAHPVTKEYHCRKNGADRTYKHTDWVADVNTHQFRHEFVCMLCMANVPEEISIQIVGHANAQMIHDVYMTLKPEMVQLAKEHLDSYISA